MSVKAQIQTDLAERLRTITTANGYEIDVVKVFEDEIPMGLSLEDYELPAILILEGKDTPKHELQWIKGQWLIHLQLIHKVGISDKIMKDFVNAVQRAIYANSPTLQRNDQFRSLGASTNWHIVLTDPDVNMIEANRMTEMVYEVQYHCHPTQI